MLGAIIYAAQRRVDESETLLRLLGELAGQLLLASSFAVESARRRPSAPRQIVPIYVSPATRAINPRPAENLLLRSPVDFVLNRWRRRPGWPISATSGRSSFSIFASVTQQVPHDEKLALALWRNFFFYDRIRKSWQAEWKGR